MRSPLLVIALLALAVACKKEAPPEPVAVAPRPVVVAPMTRPAPTTTPAEVAPMEESATLERVYFDFDSSALDGTDAAILTEDALILARHPSVEIEIEGHCDARGTTEYNLALGERRAWMARDALVALGVDPARIETISYGEERPAMMGEGEDVWWHNRRIEVRITYRGPGDEDVRGTLPEDLRVSVR